MKFTTENLIKIALAILLLGCLFHLPYGYYQLLRYVALAVLFQPLVKIGFGRTVWIVIDIVVAAGLILTLFLRDKRS
jgi:hypothetical protein